MSHPHRELRIQAGQLIENGKLTTTSARAKKVKQFVERLFSQSAKHDVNAVRHAFASLFNKDAAKKLTGTPAGSSVQLLRMGTRQGDRAPMSKLVIVAPTMQEAKKETQETHVKKQPKKKK